MTPASFQSRLASTSTPATALDHDCVSADAIYDAFREAMAHTRMQNKEAAYRMGLDPAQLSRQLAGEGHLPADRIPRLGQAFQREFVARWASALGLRVVATDATRESLRKVMHALTDYLAQESER